MRLPAVLALALTLSPAGLAAQEVGPGPSSVPGTEAVQMFMRICAATLPVFRGAEQVIAGYPLRQHPDTGTYFHTDLDLSVKLHVLDGDAVCSLVFSSPDSEQALVRAFVDSVTGLYSQPAQVEQAGGATIAYLPGGAVFEFTAGDSGLYRALMAAGEEVADQPAPTASPDQVQAALVQMVMPLDASGGGGMAAAYATCLLGRGEVESTAGFLGSRGFDMLEDAESGEVVLFSGNSPYGVMLSRRQPFCMISSESVGTAEAAAHLLQVAGGAGLEIMPAVSAQGCTGWRIGDARVEVGSTGQDPSCEDPGNSALRFTWGN